MAKRADIVRALHDRGMTYEEIGQLLGISKQAAHQIATEKRDGFRESIVRKVKYVGLRNWMLENRVNLCELGRRCGGERRLDRCLMKDCEPRKSTIDAILSVTGLTYEECFKEDTHD